ncbi:hypothetical protein C0989_005285 [Termitomyces sp. Mn162]|nr:hypothetical protein C0989_005285 [Termitomyces sp. Mn162]
MVSRSKRVLSYYKGLLTNDNDHAMTTLEHAAHSMRRKGYAPHYTPSNIAQFQPEMHEATLELVRTLESMSGAEPLDCLSIFRHLMVDAVVSFSYGYRLGAVSKWAVNVEDPLSTAINDFPKRGIIRCTVPNWLWNLISRIPNNRWRQMCDSDKIMAEFVSGRVYEMRAQMNAGKDSETDKVSMLLSFVSGGATTSKFLTMAATTILTIACAKFWPPQTREPVPKGSMW